jgi:hypothetical protein
MTSSVEKGPQVWMVSLLIVSLLVVRVPVLSEQRMVNTGQFDDDGDTGDNSFVLGELLGTNGESDGQDVGHRIAVIGVATLGGVVTGFGPSFPSLVMSSVSRGVGFFVSEGGRDVEALDGV